MGALPPNPLENKKIQTRPVVRVPRATGREGKKGSYGEASPPNPLENKKIQTLPVVRVPRTTGREGKKEAMGASPPNPLENNKDSNPPCCRVPRATGREGKKEAMGAPPPNPLENNKDSNPPCCSRAANNRAGRKKGEEWGLFAPKPPTGAPRPQTPSVWLTATRHDRTWAVTILSSPILAGHSAVIAI